MERKGIALWQMARPVLVKLLFAVVKNTVRRYTKDSKKQRNT